MYLVTGLFAFRNGVFSWNTRKLIIIIIIYIYFHFICFLYQPSFSAFGESVLDMISNYDTLYQKVALELAFDSPSASSP